MARMLLSGMAGHTRRSKEMIMTDVMIGGSRLIESKTITQLRPAPNQLAPSSYPLRLGEIDVLVISDGVLLLPTITMSTNANPAARVAWLDDMFLPQDAFDWPLNVVVVRSGGRTVLVDARLGAEYPDFPRAGQLPLRLAAAGVDLASVTDVVLTHLHMDHVGGLLVDGLKEQLHPDLRIHVAAAEVTFWASPDFSHTAARAGAGRASVGR
jgi:glyoxylase-like metal-dependent hydrolase (beta-lactamase superfamily II)